MNGADERRADEVLREVDKPDIEVKDVPLRVCGRESLAALTWVNELSRENTNLPKLYVRGGEPVRVKYNEENELTIQELDVDKMTFELTNAADFIAASPKGDPKMVFPPRDVARYCLSALEWSFPALTGVTKVPLFRPDGTLLSERGYDDPTGLIYDPPEDLEISVPEEPTQGDVEEALKLISEMIGDFPYQDQASLANTLALALTPVLREAIDGPVPLAAIDKPSPGTGASLLVENLALVTTGKDPGALGASEADEEMRKLITSMMRSGERFIFMDNVNVELKSAALARALTASVWEDRILGVSKTLRAPVRQVWAASANNLELSLEIARRTYWIRLDAQVARPWKRAPEEFTHPDLRTWVSENRSALLSALLTIGRRWFSEGQPVPESVPTMGSYESWSKVLGGVLHSAGVDGFLLNADQLYERASAEVGMWTFFLESLHEAYGDDPMTSAHIVEALQDSAQSRLREALPDQFNPSDENLSRKIGTAFANHEGVRYGAEGYHVVRAGEVQRAVQWSVRRTTDEADDEGRPSL
jgi:putative DNA primase/helicase